MDLGPTLKKDGGLLDRGHDTIEYLTCVIHGVRALGSVNPQLASGLLR